MKTLATLCAIALLTMSPAVLRGQEKQPANQTTLAQLVKQHGLPRFTAQSLSFRHGRLSAPGLESVDPATVTPAQLKGRSLIFCDARAALWLWAVNTKARMEEATPLLGYQGPTDLAAPARALLVVTDKKGVVVRMQAVTITELEGVRRGPGKRREKAAPEAEAGRECE